MKESIGANDKGRLDLSGWAHWPDRIWQGGAALAALGLVAGWFSGGLMDAFAATYIVAFMFYLSLVLGSLFLVLIHHLFDSYWLVPLRRLLEHLSCQAGIMGLFFVPILGIVLFGSAYAWTQPEGQDHSWHVKSIMYNPVAFTIMSALLFGVWHWLANGLRRHSLAQDNTGAAAATHAMRRYAAGGIFVFAFTLTLGAFYWMKSLEHQWFSTMYGVYYFAGSVWVTLATVYVLTLVLRRTGHLAKVVSPSTFKDIGTLFFAFTVFYAYIAFSQYFLIWNANIPEETYWYVKRDQGLWYGVGLLLIFGHFFVPFLLMLRIDAKLSLTVMIPLGAWAWLMHYTDMSFNVIPAFDWSQAGWSVKLFGLLTAVGAMALMGGALARFLLRDLAAHPPYPQRDPRIAETLNVYVEPLSARSARSSEE